MPFALFDDRHSADPIWAYLARGKAAKIVVLRDAFVCLSTTSAAHQANGYLTTGMVATALADHSPADRSKLPEILCESALGRPAKVHRRGDECPCIPSVWGEGWEFYVHEFLKRNPSRKEKALRDAKRRDLADPQLRRTVFKRDGLYCRYCWSGPLNSKLGAAKFPEAAQLMPTVDHIDPSVPADADGNGVVTACRRCNQAKANCTPEAVGMPVLPPPTPEDVARLPVNFRATYTVSRAAERDARSSVPSTRNHRRII